METSPDMLQLLLLDYIAVGVGLLRIGWRRVGLLWTIQ